MYKNMKKSNKDKRQVQFEINNNVYRDVFLNK